MPEVNLVADSSSQIGLSKTDRALEQEYARVKKQIDSLNVDAIDLTRPEFIEAAKEVSEGVNNGEIGDFPALTFGTVWSQGLQYTHMFKEIASEVPEYVQSVGELAKATGEAIPSALEQGFKTVLGIATSPFRWLSENYNNPEAWKGLISGAINLMKDITLQGVRFLWEATGLPGIIEGIKLIASGRYKEGLVSLIAGIATLGYSLCSGGGGVFANIAIRSALKSASKELVKKAIIELAEVAGKEIAESGLQQIASHELKECGESAAKSVVKNFVDHQGTKSVDELIQMGRETCSQQISETFAKNGVEEHLTKNMSEFVIRLAKDPKVTAQKLIEMGWKKEDAIKAAKFMESRLNAPTTIRNFQGAKIRDELFEEIGDELKSSISKNLQRGLETGEFGQSFSRTILQEGRLLRRAGLSKDELRELYNASKEIKSAGIKDACDTIVQNAWKKVPKLRHMSKESLAFQLPKAPKTKTRVTTETITHIGKAALYNSLRIGGEGGVARAKVEISQIVAASRQQLSEVRKFKDKEVGRRFSFLVKDANETVEERSKSVLVGKAGADTAKDHGSSDKKMEHIPINNDSGMKKEVGVSEVVAAVTKGLQKPSSSTA